MADMQSRDARDYSIIRDKIAQDFYRASGMHEKDIAADLTREQIADLSKYADTLPFFSTDRKDFKEAVKMAEQSLESRESAEAARREGDQHRYLDVSTRTEEQSLSHGTPNTERSDRENSRGR